MWAFRRVSYKFFVTIKDKAVAVLIPVRIVAVNFHDFGDETPTRPPLKMHDDIYGVSHVGLDGAVGQIDAALQNAIREAGEALFCGSSVQGRKTPGMSGVEKLQKIEGLTSANFAQDQSIRPMTKRGFEQIPNGDGGHAVLRLPGLKSDEIVLAHVNFGGVLDEEDSFICRDKFPEHIEQ